MTCDSGHRREKEPISSPPRSCHHHLVEQSCLLRLLQKDKNSEACVTPKSQTGKRRAKALLKILQTSWYKMSVFGASWKIFNASAIKKIGYSPDFYMSAERFLREFPHYFRVHHVISCIYFSDVSARFQICWCINTFTRGRFDSRNKVFTKPKNSTRHVIHHQYKSGSIPKCTRTKFRSG